jgi:hypothetical protein
MILVCSLFASATGILSADQPVTPGDTVVVAKDNVQLGVRDKPMTTVNLGTEITVTEVRGNWLGGYAFLNGNKRFGWVHQSEVRQLPSAKRSIPVEPAKPDNPEDVAAWKKLGVSLHMDEAGNVQHVRAESAVVQDQDLIHLAGLPSLLSLDLSNQPVTDQGMSHVGGCVGLQKVYLGGTGVGDTGIEKLAKLARLEVLACPKTQVTGAALQHVGSLADLQVLNLSHCAIDDEHLRHLNTLSRLEVLVLAHTKITDAGMEHLRLLAKLRVLNLDGTTVKGPGFDNLLGLSELRMLYVRDCQVELGVTDKLDDKMPGLAIYD